MTRFGLEFCPQTLVTLLLHPVIQLLPQTGFDFPIFSVAGQIVLLKGIVLEVIQLHSRSMGQKLDASSQLGVLSTILLPGLVNRGIMNSVDPEFVFESQIEDQLVAVIPYRTAGIKPGQEVIVTISDSASTSSSNPDSSVIAILLLPIYGTLLV